MSELDDFERYRTRLFALAYRMLGSAAEAEDVVQDAWLRYAGAQRSDLRSPLAYLTTIVTRLALDRLKSARTTREQYVGAWLPEPLAGTTQSWAAGKRKRQRILFQHRRRKQEFILRQS